MKRKMKRWLAVVLTLVLFVCNSNGYTVLAEEQKKDAGAPEMRGTAAVLIEYETGKVLFDYNKDSRVPPASITKVMTMSLVLEQIEQGNLTMEDIVTTSEHAMSMGGTKIYLEVGEQMNVYDLMMSVALASANDSAVALGEHIAGSEEAFVAMMNEKAKELGMENTTFKNASGWPAEGHLTTAYDIALMTRYLMEFDQSLEFIGTNMYPIREGERQYQMVNTNELLRTYEGCIGGKTGYTEEAQCCLTTAATRDGITLIAVTLGSDTSRIRNEDTAALLDYGFANYELLKVEPETVTVDPIPVVLGMEKTVEVEIPQMEAMTEVIKKGTQPEIQQTVTVDEELHAPVIEGQKVGTVTITMDGEELASYDLTAKQAVEKRTFWKTFLLLIQRIFSL